MTQSYGGSQVESPDHVTKRVGLGGAQELSGLRRCKREKIIENLKSPGFSPGLSNLK